jgi:hypothetical protein
MLVFNLPINPMYLISLANYDLIKLLYRLSQRNLENKATVRLLVLISTLCFSSQCSKGPIVLLQFTDVSTRHDLTMAFILLGSTEMT